MCSAFLVYMHEFSFTSGIWLYPAMDAWHFITVAPAVSAEIKGLVMKTPRRGFGAVKVIARIGKTSWETSIFPDKRSGCYLLPLKAAIRKKEGLFVKDNAKVTLRLL